MSRWNSVSGRKAQRGLAALAVTAGLAAAAGCGGGGSTGTGGETGTGGKATGTGGNGTGGMGSSMISSAKPIGATFASAFDATMSNSGSIIYFTGVGTNGSGVYSVPAGGGTPSPIAEGAPLAAPFGIALSTDGKALYIADPGAKGAPLDSGRILTVNPEGGTPTALPGADDLQARGLDVIAEGGKDQIYFSGVVGGKPGIFKIPAAGGTVTTLSSGAPFLDPEGLAVTKSGTVYVVDAIGGKSGKAAIRVFDGTTVSEFVPDLRVGYPCGIALSQDEKTLVVSSVDPAKGGSSLLVIDIFSKEPTRFPTDGSLDALREPGGLHRARNANQFAWVSYDPAGSSLLLVK